MLFIDIIVSEKTKQKKPEIPDADPAVSVGPGDDSVHAVRVEAVDGLVIGLLPRAVAT